MTDEPDEPADVLRLDHFLKRSGVADTGGQAKVMIQNGDVKVNGEVDTRRRKKLVKGDVVEVNGQKLVVKD
ncbi:ribosome-associated protein [Anatilimnocola aggregata]|uniref:Ribosome-associated protein n=1 Tax=Anatilimnocola aggregata TaxID=2528021 RepID=A0A517YA58_9BACT|nr:RNA-binding S4 domain-containing protein [Anatilimnocola aggregata]QDU27120.1 ribosome-associated protein [Anatilimnocola aggregata]